MLGISGQPIGILNQSSIVFAHEPLGWCVNFITTQSNGQVILNAWAGYTVSV
jgi:hypothetical protein